MRVDWFFDFISPFSYLAHESLGSLPDTIEIHPVPVLFAEMLSYWEHKGPAEIPAKRLYTYRFCVWYAQANGIPFQMPPSHPFNPLSVLRLAIALECAPDAIATIFRFIWKEGRDVALHSEWAELTSRLGVSKADERIAEASVKSALRTNTQDAIDRGVFGVPTAIASGPDGDELFWGVEAIPMLCDYVANPGSFRTGQMGRVLGLPKGAERKLASS